MGGAESCNTAFLFANYSYVYAMNSDRRLEVAHMHIYRVLVFRLSAVKAKVRINSTKSFSGHVYNLTFVIWGSKKCAPSMEMIFCFEKVALRK